MALYRINIFQYCDVKDAVYETCFSNKIHKLSYLSGTGLLENRRRIDFRDRIDFNIQISKVYDSICTSASVSCKLALKVFSLRFNQA